MQPSELHPSELPTLGVIIVAAGRGERLGSEIPKAFVEIAGRPLLEYTLRTVTQLPSPGQVILVVPDGSAANALEIVDAAIPPASPWQVSVVPGGRERHESVRNGLAVLADSIDTVLIHDAARPLTPASVFERVVAEVHRTRDGVVPAIPIADTLKRIDDSGVVISTEDRGALVAVQTPQGFVREQIEAAHESAQARESVPSEGNGVGADTAAARDLPTDDAEVLQRFGGIVRTVPGDELSHKVTTPADLLMLQGLISGQDPAA